MWLNDDDITLCTDERGALLIDPYVAQIARAFGRSDLGYVLGEYTSLRFYRELTGYVRKIPPTFAIANVLRNKIYTGPPSGGHRFPIPTPAIFDYLAALDEVQRTTGITSLRELEAQVAPPHLEEGYEACDD